MRWCRTGVSIATLGLALSAHAANVKLGTDAGGLVFDPDTVTIKAGESVTWTNNAGAPMLSRSAW
jgi:plastocyanin